MLLAAGAKANGAEEPLIIVTRGTAPVCFDSATLRAKVAARFFYDPFAGATAPRVTVEVWADGADLASHVTLMDQAGHKLGERQLRAANCAELAEALTVVLRVALDRDLVARAPPPKPPPPPPPPPPKPPPDFTLWIGLGVAPTVQATPTFAIKSTLGLEGRWRSAPLSLGVEASLVLPFGQATAQSGSYEEQLLLGAVVPCYRWRAFGGCGVVTAGAARVQGFLYPNAGTSVETYVALGARVQGDLPLSGWLALRLDIEILAPVVKPSITLKTDPAPLWTQPSVSGEVGITLLARL